MNRDYAGALPVVVSYLILAALAVATLWVATDEPTYDPIRYCYTVKDGHKPWSCYLHADRPEGYTPVWVGPHSQVKEAYVNQ